MNTEQAVLLLHELTRDKGVTGEVDIKVNEEKKLDYSYHIHAPKEIIGKLMAKFVKVTGIKLEKGRITFWQSASGSKGNISASFYPKGNVFQKCKIEKTITKVWVEPTEGHYEEKVVYEAICKNGEEEKK